MNADPKQKPNELDRNLPIANIGRIIKNNLPKEVKLSKDAKETFQECVSEFISFITSEACDRCNGDQRKTVNGDDILYAMTNLGFEKYVPILKTYLEKYRESQKIPESLDEVKKEKTSEEEQKIFNESSENNN